MQKLTLTSVLSLRERKQICTRVINLHEVIAWMWAVPSPLREKVRIRVI
jgi:hypothetical protein